MVTPSRKPTRRERVARRVYEDEIPPRGEAHASRAGIGLALLALLIVASGVIAAIGRSAVVPSLVAVAALAWVLYAFFDFIGGV